MVSRKHFWGCFLTIALATPGLATPVLAAPWVRGFVVDNYEPAYYFGGKAGYGDAATQPGSDCPKGNIWPNIDYKGLLKTPWRTEADLEAIVNPPGADSDPEYLQKVHVLEERAMEHRGYRKEIDTYINPFAAPDPGMQYVTGKIAEGFDLDGNPKTGGFASPTGQKGIDNQLYRAWGCTLSYRGKPYSAYLSVRAIDKMREGLFTMVVRVSGNQDPSNDNDATVEIGYSPDHMVKNASDNVASGYSFRLVKGTQYTKMKASIRNGALETLPVAELRFPDFAWFPDNAREVLFYKGRIRLTMNADGSVSGLLGGYRDWKDLYTKETFTQAGATQEVAFHQNQIGMYYALKRSADGIPDPKTGQNTAISAAFRFTGVHAHVVDPATPVGVTVLEASRKDITKFDTMRKITLLAVATRQIQQPPSREKRAPAAPPPAAPQQGVQQVNNAGPAAVASAASR